MIRQTCHRCKCEMWIPEALHEAALKARGPDGISFYCAYGHGQFYTEGESEETKLRRECDKLQQRLAEKDDQIETQRRGRQEAERKLSATRGVVTRIKNRIGHGVCPCCNRSFGNLARHMLTQHPKYSAEAAE